MQSSKFSLIPQELLDDIASRFLLDAPDRELKNPISLCFLTELAYWFYLDEYVEEDDSLNTVKFDIFALQLLQHVKIEPDKGTIEEMLQDFRDFKHRVPTYGALLLNTDLTQVLLVQGFWHRASWGFPKGKINVEEEPHKCAIREVLEETGYDISSKMNSTLYIETTIGEQSIRLYIIPGVSMTTEFVPRTKGEIKELKWFNINQLPTHKNDRNYANNFGPTTMFYMVMPFVKPLRDWVASQSRSVSLPADRNTNGRDSRRRHKSLNTNSDRNFYSSPGATSVPPPDPKGAGNPYIQQVLTGAAPPPEVDRGKKGQTEASPRKREGKFKAKGKKKNVNNADFPSIDSHQQQKFTFKSRAKSKGQNPTTSNSSRVPLQNSSNNHPPTIGSNFKSYSWQNFRINKRAINEALDKVWLGVTIQIDV